MEEEFTMYNNYWYIHNTNQYLGVGEQIYKTDPANDPDYAEGIPFVPDRSGLSASFSGGGGGAGNVTVLDGTYHRSQDALGYPCWVPDTVNHMPMSNSFANSVYTVIYRQSYPTYYTNTGPGGQILMWYPFSVTEDTLPDTGISKANLLALTMQNPRCTYQNQMQYATQSFAPETSSNGFISWWGSNILGRSNSYNPTQASSYTHGIITYNNTMKWFNETYIARSEDGIVFTAEIECSPNTLPINTGQWGGILGYANKTFMLPQDHFPAPVWLFPTNLWNPDGSFAFGVQNAVSNSVSQYRYSEQWLGRGPFTAYYCATPTDGTSENNSANHAYANTIFVAFNLTTYTLVYYSYADVLSGTYDLTTVTANDTEFTGSISPVTLRLSGDIDIVADPIIANTYSGESYEFTYNATDNVYNDPDGGVYTFTVVNEAPPTRRWWNNKMVERITRATSATQYIYTYDDHSVQYTYPEVLTS